MWIYYIDYYTCVKTLQDCKTLPRVHLIGCRGVKLLWLKDFFVCQKLSCQDKIFLSFVTIWVLSFCHDLSFCVLSQFECLSFLTIWICKNLSFLVAPFSVFEFDKIWSFQLSHLKFLSLVTIWVFELFQFKFLSLFKILVFSVLSQFELIFVTIWIVAIWFFSFLAIWVL